MVLLLNSGASEKRPPLNINQLTVTNPITPL